MQTLMLKMEPVTQSAFQAYGTLMQDIPDGQLFGPEEAQLELAAGTPRFYIMKLAYRPLHVHMITRHRKVTQCLASVGGMDWFLVVAPPDNPDDAGAEPDLAGLRGFRIPGNVGIKLHRGTWHAGPFFHGNTASFFNLELADTNQIDHQSAMLGVRFGIEYDLQI